MIELINELYNLFEMRDKTPINNRQCLNKHRQIKIRNDLIKLSADIKNIYPHYSSELFLLKDKLYKNILKNSQLNIYEVCFEPSTFSKVHTILKALKHEVDNDNNLGFWQYIHTKIFEACNKMFLDGYYNKSVLTAYIEIEVRLKAIYKILKPNEKELIGAKLITTIFSDNEPTLLQFQNRENEEGRNVQKGFMQIFAGAMTGIRNLPAHGNTEITKEDAVRKLMLASLLMYKIDDAIIFTNINEQEV